MRQTSVAFLHCTEHKVTGSKIISLPPSPQERHFFQTQAYHTLRAAMFMCLTHRSLLKQRKNRAAENIRRAQNYWFIFSCHFCCSFSAEVSPKGREASFSHSTARGTWEDTPQTCDKGCQVVHNVYQLLKLWKSPWVTSQVFMQECWQAQYIHSNIEMMSWH